MKALDQLELELQRGMARHQSSLGTAAEKRPRKRATPRAVALSVMALAFFGAGSAALAGVDIFGPLRAADTVDPARQPVGPEVRLAADDGSWAARAYETLGASACLVARWSDEPATRSCVPSVDVLADTVAAASAGAFATAQLTQDGHRTLIYGFVGARVKHVEIRSNAGRPLMVSPGAELLSLKRDPARVGGLDKAQLSKLQSLPAQADVRLFAATVDADKGTTGGAVRVLTRDGDTAVLSLVARPSDEAAPSEETLDGYPQPVASATRDQAAEVPALARARVESRDQVSVPLEQRLLGLAAQPALSRRLTITGGGTHAAVWAMPANRYVCLQSTAPDLTRCRPNALASGLTAVVCSPGFDPQKRLVWGLVPSGTDAIRVTNTDGTIERLAAADLLVLERDRTAPQVAKVEWHETSGWTAEVSPMPSDASQNQCG